MKKHLILSIVALFCAFMYYLVVFYASDKAFFTAPNAGMKVLASVAMGFVSVYITPLITKYIIREKKKD